VSPTTQCLEADKLKMRRWVVTNILDSERAYLSTLDILLQVRSLRVYSVVIRKCRSRNTLRDALIAGLENWFEKLGFWSIFLVFNFFICLQFNTDHSDKLM